MISNHLDFMGKDCRPSLYNKVDVPQCNILYLRFCREQCYKRRSHFFAKISDNISTGDEFHLLEDHLQHKKRQNMNDEWSMSS